MQRLDSSLHLLLFFLEFMATSGPDWYVGVEQNLEQSAAVR